MNLYSIIVFVHVASATVLVGGSLSSPCARSSLRRAHSVGEVSRWVDFMRRSTRAHPAAAVVLLGSGLYLGTAGWWSQAWFVLAVGLYFVNGAWAARVVAGETERIGQAAAALPDGLVPPALDELRKSERLDLAANVMLGADAAVLFGMITKPSWAGAVMAAALGVGGAVAYQVLKPRPRPLPTPQ